MSLMQLKAKASDSYLKRERRLKLAAVGLILLLSVVTVIWVDNLLLSVIFAFVINYLLGPITDFLENRGLSRLNAVLFPFLGAGLLIALGILLFLPLVSDQMLLLESQLPQYQADLTAVLSRLESRVSGITGGMTFSVSESVNQWLFQQTGYISRSLPAVVATSATVLLLSPLFAFFMLLDGKNISRSFFDLVPNNLFELSLNLHHQISGQLGDFIRARLLESAIVGVVVWLGLLVLGFPYATLLALFAALMNLIPYVGPILGAVPAIVIGYVSKDGLVVDPMSLNLVVIMTVFLVAQIIDVALIIPLVVAKVVNLHPVMVIISIIIGAQIMGILGMVISIPVASTLKLFAIALYHHILEPRPLR